MQTTVVVVNVLGEVETFGDSAGKLHVVESEPGCYVGCVSLAQI